uniref:J domain-containing protein n=1 Tax=Mesocestoides corti TaxID=53468 RepID=A0A5K3FGK4_MESCO
MEANRDAAQLCRDRAVKHFKEGNIAEAIRFAKKAQNLDPNIEIPECITSSNGDVPLRRRRRSSPSNVNPSQRDVSRPRDKSEEKNFTKAQVESVRRIMACKDLYSLLGVKKDASEDDIKRAYKSLARKFHPDKNKAPGATEAFKKIGSAFNVLVDPVKRRRYDQFGTIEQTSPAVTRQHHGGVYTFDANGAFDADFINMFFGGGFPFSQNVRYTRHAQRHESNQEGGVSVFQILPLLFLFLLSLMSRFLQELLRL